MAGLLPLLCCVLFAAPARARMHGEPLPKADTAPPRLVGGKVVHDDVSDAFLTAVAEMHTDFCTAHPLGWSRVGPCLKFNMEKAT